jgi:hypothetical protein
MRGREIRDDREISSHENSVLGGLAASMVEEMMDTGYDRGEEIGPSSYFREVNIKPLSSGYLVNVGCQTVAVETTETLLKRLGEYLNNPTQFEKEWKKNPNRNKL